MTSKAFEYTWIPALAGCFQPGRRMTVASIIMHSTDGREQGDIATLTGHTDRKVSVHWYVTRTGKIYHFVDDGDTAYDVGDVIAPQFSNSASVGIEQEHFDDQDEDWPDVQIEKAAEICTFLIQQYNLNVTDIHSHAFAARPSGRKIDPKNYPFNQLFALIQDNSAFTWQAINVNDENSVQINEDHTVDMGGSQEDDLADSAEADNADSANNNTGITQILEIAANSEIMQYEWKDRGRAPKGYIQGMAVVYARVYCKLIAGDPAAVEMSKPVTGDTDHDALAWYSQQFLDAGMSNLFWKDTLRHLFVLMIGLGMRESSGKYCEGRDKSASNTTAETAEAGLFQTSYNARQGSPLMPQLFIRYAGKNDFVEIFAEDVTCNEASWENYGTGPGADFQELSKKCPAFAAEFAAVGLRNIRKHWGPINARAAEIRSECDDMLKAVQDAVDTSHLCPI